MKYLDTFAIDNEILKFNRILNESDTEEEIRVAENMLQEEMNYHFRNDLPYAFSLFKVIPFDFDCMKEKIRVYSISNSLFLEFPRSFDKEYNYKLKIFGRYLEESWPNRVKTIYKDGKGPRYIIKLVSIN